MERHKLVASDFITDRRHKLIISLVISAIVFFISQNRAPGSVTFMLTWISFALWHLIASWMIILRYHPTTGTKMAKDEDWSWSFIFLFIVLAAFISLFAIIFLLRSMPDVSEKGLSMHILLAIASVFCSWMTIHTLFTLKYAHIYYSKSEQKNDNNDKFGEGLNFPEEKEPDYLDFAYFSFVIGMTFQVSDVQITSRKIRHLSLLHAFLSFVYNTVIVALSINIISGIISK